MKWSRAGRAGQDAFHELVVFQDLFEPLPPLLGAVVREPDLAQAAALDTTSVPLCDIRYQTVFPILAVFRLKGQPRRDVSIVGQVLQGQSISGQADKGLRDAFAVVDHPSCPSSLSSGPPPMG